jgi:hypothetical protein
VPNSVSILNSIRDTLSKCVSFISVRDPLLFFAACAGIVGYELHCTIRDLSETQVIGLVAVAILAIVFIMIVRTLGRITERNPAHLYHDIELLKQTLNSRSVLREVVGKLVSEYLQRMKDERIRKDDAPEKRETYLAARNRNRFPSFTGRK